MKMKWIAGVLLTAMTISACDENTQGIGSSFEDDVDRFTILTDTFEVTSRSIIVDSVLARSSSCYLGCMKDPETNDYVASSYTTQFVQLEALAYSLFPDEEYIVSRIGDKAIVDSCHLNIYIDSYEGDTLAPMKLMVHELSRPAKENIQYYSDFDPEEEDMIRTDGLKKEKSYAYVNYLLNDSLRSSSFMHYINIQLNDPYTDKKGNVYNNYGTYLLQSYYKYPAYFKNSLTFAQNICPGFYIQTIDGAGLMSKIYTTELAVFYQVRNDDGSVKTNARRFTATEEILQTSNIYHNKERIKELANDNTCTYLKTPAGIFTEVTLPIDDIMFGHEKDTLASAQISFERYNSVEENALEAPDYLVMLPKAQLYSFFEEKNVPDSKTSFLGSLNSTYNTYEFSNISTLITTLWNNRANAGEDWNKVVLVPVERNSGNIAAATTTKISNLMSLTSTRLVGGTGNTHKPITISVIYSKNN